MNTAKNGGKLSWLIAALFISFLCFGCTPTAESCPRHVGQNLEKAEAYAAESQYPYQFPIADYKLLTRPIPFMTNFADFGRTHRGPEYHAAEDIFNPAGTPVYAMADGRVSYSGRMDGYGWLVIIDHPQADLYSLYGHLSPSRWEIENRTEVVKGQLIGYLGDDFENGGTEEEPLIEHLHFGVRVGQRTDYSGLDEWRWMGGWIAPCPQDAGWLQPSLVITSQDLEIGQTATLAVNWFTLWRMELLLAGVYFVAAGSMAVSNIKKDKPVIIMLSGGFLLIVSIVFSQKLILLPAVSLGLGVVILLLGIVRWRRKRERMSEASEGEADQSDTQVD